MIPPMLPAWLPSRLPGHQPAELPAGLPAIIPPMLPAWLPTWFPIYLPALDHLIFYLRKSGLSVVSHCVWISLHPIDILSQYFPSGQALSQVLKIFQLIIADYVHL